MHIKTLPYAQELRTHAEAIENRLQHPEWGEDTPIYLEISIVYSAVIIRKLWEHYDKLYLEGEFSLLAPMAGLHEVGSLKEQTGLTFVHRIIHSQRIDTSEQTKATGIEFQSDLGGEFRVDYDSVLVFLRKASAATEVIHG